MGLVELLDDPVRHVQVVLLVLHEELPVVVLQQRQRLQESVADDAASACTIADAAEKGEFEPRASSGFIKVGNCQVHCQRRVGRICYFRLC